VNIALDGKGAELFRKLAGHMFTKQDKLVEMEKIP